MDLVGEPKASHVQVSWFSIGILGRQDCNVPTNSYIRNLLSWHVQVTTYKQSTSLGTEIAGPAVAAAASSSDGLTSAANSLPSHNFCSVASEQSPTLLTLPREACNSIWAHALVRTEIHVAWVACEDNIQKSHSRSCHNFQYRQPYTGKITQRSGTYVGLSKQPIDWLDLTACAVMEILEIETDMDIDQPCLNTLLVCRQVYNEAAPIFYSQNCFVFGSSETLGISGSTALLPAYTSLKDRSENIL